MINFFNFVYIVIVLNYVITINNNLNKIIVALEQIQNEVNLHSTHNFSYVPKSEATIAPREVSEGFVEPLEGFVEPQAAQNLDSTPRISKHCVAKQRKSGVEYIYG